MESPQLVHKNAARAPSCPLVGDKPGGRDVRLGFLGIPKNQPDVRRVPRHVKDRTEGRATCFPDGLTLC
jgi:hypothetical protein